jgi:hypothetical protein
MDTPEKLTRNGTQEKLKQKHNADSTKKQGLSQVLTKGQQFMFLIWHLPCYSCIHSSPVKVSLPILLLDLTVYTSNMAGPLLLQG